MKIEYIYAIAAALSVPFLAVGIFEAFVKAALHTAIVHRQPLDLRQFLRELPRHYRQTIGEEISSIKYLASLEENEG